MYQEEVIIVGGGPCGLAAAIALKEVGIDSLVIEKGNIVHAIYHYPTHQTFFSSSENLEIGNIPFLTPNHRPKRNEALVYYREVAKRKQLRIHTYEIVEKINQTADKSFQVYTNKRTYRAQNIVIATGYYDHPNYLNIPGENLPKVSHYFKEAHPFFNQDVAVIGGKNSSVDTSLELVKAGARVTVLYRGKKYSNSIKPWILPQFQSLVNHGKITMEFGAHVTEITEKKVFYNQNGKEKQMDNDFVFAMTGYHPDRQFLSTIGVQMDQDTGRPFYNPETMETNVAGVFIAGVIAAGNNANEIFIENGRLHGALIAKTLTK